MVGNLIQPPKPESIPEDPPMREEYDFSAGAHKNYDEPEQRGANIRVSMPIYNALEAYSVRPWWHRLWILVSNPFLYVFTGKIRW